MPFVFLFLFSFSNLVATVFAQDHTASVTIHNGGFAVVRERLELELERGTSTVSFSEVAAHVEPASVILRAVAGGAGGDLRVLEQNYRNDAVTQELLLSLYEGQTIDFLVFGRDGEPRRVSGRIVRSGYVPHQQAWGRYGNAYVQRQMAFTQGSGAQQPIIEVDGELRFSLPGQPLFPALGDDSILEPTLHWVLESERAGRRTLELTYITGGMAWDADYNLVAGEGGDTIDLSAWVTIDNNSGRSFPGASLKLMAGDVRKLQALGFVDASYSVRREMDAMGGAPVTERSFDEYHLYTLERPTDLRDRQTKQVEFLRAAGIPSRRLYVYDGAAIDRNRYSGWNADMIRREPSYGTEANPKVWVMREVLNTEQNGLGVPLPKGRFRFYQRDGEELEFVGEDEIDHTPRGETLRLYTGNAFDLVGERVQTNYRIDSDGDELDESFRITLRNRKQEPVEIVVVEHLYRWLNWEIADASHEWVKRDARTIELTVSLQPDEEVEVSYTAHYSW
jgi:hypothetical protein